MEIKSVSQTHIGLKRGENQDRVKAWPEIGLFLVADGMGGERAGGDAAQQAVESIEEHAAQALRKSPPPHARDMAQLLTRAVEAANAAILDISAKNPKMRGLGTTASLLALHKGTYTIAQVGDSRVYRLREHKLAQLTPDHTLVWQFYRSGAIKKADIETHPDRHLLTRSLGSGHALKVDVVQGKVLPGDCFLLCSDGLTGYAGEAATQQILESPEGDLEAKAAKLIEAALAGGGGDNVSVILAEAAGVSATDDNWRPDPMIPENYEGIASIEEPAAAASEDEPPSGKGKIWAGAIGALVGLGILAFVLMSRGGGVESTLEFSSPIDLANSTFAVFDPAGEEVSGAVRGSEGNKLALRVPKEGPYKLKVKTAGTVAADVDLSVSAGELAPAALESGVIELKYGDAAARKISELTLVTGSGKTEYSWKPGRAAPPSVLNVRPNAVHKLVISGGEGAPFEYETALPAGSKEEVVVPFAGGSAAP